MKSKIYIGKYDQKIYRNQHYQLHRLDGPAIEYPVQSDHFNEWWINNKQYSNEEFNRIIKLKVFL